MLSPNAPKRNEAPVRKISRKTKRGYGKERDMISLEITADQPKEIADILLALKAIPLDPLKIYLDVGELRKELEKKDDED